jgi:hypothetical protein
MFLKTIAIEYSRKSPQTIVAALHPGTTDTRLSQPFQRNVPPEKLFSTERTVRQLLAIVIGCGGVIGLFYLANRVVERFFPSRTQNRILPWIYLAPAALVLTAYLVLPTVLTVYISFFDKRSQNFVWFTNYLDLLTDKVMWEAFRNNILWLVLVTGVSVSLGLVIAVLADRVRYEPIPKALIFLPMAISFVGASVIWRFVYDYRPADDRPNWHPQRHGDQPRDLSRSGGWWSGRSITLP